MPENRVAEADFSLTWPGDGAGPRASLRDLRLVAAAAEQPPTAGCGQAFPPNLFGRSIQWGAGPTLSRMTPIQRAVEARGSLIATHELHRMGIGRATIGGAVSTGELVRVRQGWYANPWLDHRAQQAARIGGQLACLSAARHWGLWLFDDPRLHVCVDPNACQLRNRTSHRTRLAFPSSPEVVVHWTGADHSLSRVVVAPLTCLRQVVACCDAEQALVVAESALNRGLVRRSEWDAVAAAATGPARRTLSAASALSGSGTETLFVHRIRRAGIAVRQQVRMPGIGYVDCLIGDRLVVELDSVAHHTDPTTDRRRDALLSARGYRVLRFMYTQVVDRWPEVEAAVVAALSRGDHLPA